MIEPKQKPCKGIGKAKGFDGCGKETYKRTYGLCPSCYADWLLSTPEGKEKLTKATIKAIKPRLELEEAIKEKNERTS